MLTIDNVTTADDYTDASTLGPVATAESIAIVVANNSVMAQVAATDAAGTIQGWGPELLLTPQSTVLTRAQGVRFRSAVAGAHAQVVAQLFEPRDPLLSGGNAFTSTLSPGGGISPAVSVLQATALVRLGAVQAIAAGPASTAIIWDTVVFDDAGLFTGVQPTRLTIPPGGGGRFIITGNVALANPGSRVSYGIRQNGVGGAVLAFTEQTTAAGPNQGESICTAPIGLDPTDFVELVVAPSGAGFNTATALDGLTGCFPRFGITKIA